LKKIEGHKPTKYKDETDKKFSEVDKLVRKKLRQLPFKDSLTI